MHRRLLFFQDIAQLMLQRVMTYLQVDRTFLLLVFVFSYFLVISNRVRAGMLSWYTFTPEGPVVQWCSALLIFVLLRYWLNRQQTANNKPLNWRHYLQVLLVALLCYLTFSNGLGLLIAVVFGNVGRNFSAQMMLQSNLGHVVDVVLYAGIYLAYSHNKQAEHYKQALADYQQQLAQLKIQQLKTQLNPHFVFNSLNTLDELISVAPEQASQYLHDFAGLYRLSIHNSAEQLVPLSQELAFAQHYFQLMQTRFAEGYQLHIGPMATSAQFLLPPFTLQLLLENVFLHNHGSAAEPVLVDIQLQQNRLQVRNTKRPKPQAVSGQGVALANLSKQFLFLVNNDIEISSDSQYFSVILPLIEEASDV